MDRQDEQLMMQVTAKSSTQDARSDNLFPSDLTASLFLEATELHV